MVLLQRPAALALVLGVCATGCFDSDDKFRLAATTGEPDPTTTTVDPSTSTGEPPASSSSGEAEQTCRDAIGCLQQCALSIDPTDPEPDFSCVLACTELPGLTQREVYHLLRLIECLNGVCVDMGECEMTVDTTSTGTGTGSDSGSSTSTGSAEEEGGIGFLSPCLFCIFTMVPNADSDVCSEFHQACV